VAAPAIQFKGAGWYVTDYARKSGTSTEKTEASEKADKEKKDSKPGKQEKTPVKAKEK
jgi:predicted nucleic acid-binding Zn ribbon protein